MRKSCCHKSVNKSFGLALLISLIFLIYSSSSVYAHDLHKESKLVIGIVSNKAKNNIRFTYPLAIYLSENLTKFGINSAEVRVNGSLEQMGEWLESGEVDLVSETIFSAITLQQEFGAEMELLRWKKGADTCHSVFFTHQDSGINNLDDLVGRVVAFGDKGSTSSFFLPAATLINKGFTLNKLRSVQDIVNEGEIGYVFIEDQLVYTSKATVPAWVFRKQVDAGAFCSHDWSDPSILPLSYKNKLKIVHRSVPIPRSIILYSPELTGALKDEITSLLVNAHLNKEGKLALYTFEKTKKFERLQDKPNLIRPIEELHKIVVDTLN